MTKVQRARRQVRLSRALGIALTPKAQRLFEKRPYGPGEHGRDRRRAESDYAVRLREKQRLRAQYGDDIIADNFFQQILLHPEKFQVVALTNLNGDYASDALAAQVGGIGISPGANINYETGYAIFEATHGTAPDIAGQNKANPCSLLLSAVMMLDYLGWTEAADQIEFALEETIQAKQVTADFASAMGVEALSTSDFAQKIINKL